MSPADPMHPADPTREPRWCAEHGRHECAASRSRGRGTCHGPAITGTAKCRMHAGEPAAVARAKGEAISAWSLSGEPGVDPGRAVLAVLHMTWLRVALLAGLLERQVAAAGGGSDGGTGSESGTTGAPGLVGHRYSSGPDGLYAASEAVRGLAALEAAERERVVRFAEVASRMGVEARYLALAEQQASRVVTALMRAQEGVGLSVDVRDEVARRFVAELRELEGATV